MSKKKTATKKSTKKSGSGSTEKARQAAIAEIQTRLTKPGKSGAPKGGKAGSSAKPQRVSALAAAARVLAESDKPMRCQELIEAMQKRDLWESPKGKTPQATLSAAILREITTKSSDSRFKKVERGLFAATSGAKKGA